MGSCGQGHPTFLPTPTSQCGWMAEVNAALPRSKTPAEESTPSKNVFNESHPSKSAVETTEAQGKRPPVYSPTSSFVFTHLPGFTHFISQRNPSNPDKIFASALFAAGHGYALFYPDTILNLDDDFRDTRGISLGDVGVLLSNNQFLFAFNIFLPSDHLYNKGNVPESFLPLSPLQDSEICTTIDYFAPGYVVASKGVKVTRHSEDPLHITLRSSERRGACMVLPKGATRHDISRSSARVFDYIADNAASWARHIARSDRYSGANGSPYVVTGVDKTSVCSNLAFPSRPPSMNMSATYQNGSLRPTERMSIARGASAPENLSPLPNNLCAFMRGIRIALGRTEWLENVDDGPEEDTFYTEIFVDTPRIRLPFLNTIVWGRDEQALSDEESYFQVHAFHPSDIAAQIMLCLDPDDATAALVDDFIWSNISQAVSDKQTEVQRDPLTFTCTRGCAFDDLVSMFHDIFTMHQVMSHKGVLTFAQISQERGRQYPWHQRLWLWIIRHHMVHGGIIFKKLFLQGQFHFKTNDALRQMIEGDLEDE